MVLKYIEDRKKEDLSESNLPSWVSKDNASFLAWKYVEKCKNEKLLYIESNYKSTDFVNKGSYQIRATDVAAFINVHRTTLVSNSSYSDNFREYLVDVNSYLSMKKESVIKSAKFSPSRGSVRSSKNTLVEINKDLKKRILELESKNIEKAVIHAFDMLPLPIKAKLGIE